MRDSEHVAVVGGGIAGLATAYALSREGVRVTLFESSPVFGGLGSWFEFEGQHYDRFYHVLLQSDAHLLALMGELGLGRDVYWRSTTLGFMYRRKLYPLGTPLDLLRFQPARFVDRIRLGLTALYAGYVTRPDPLDKITAAEWLTRLSGSRAFETLWRPLLQAKFGDAYASIPAMWYWASFNREKGTRDEVKGYVKGGYRRIGEALVESLRGAGVSLHADAPVERLDLDGAGRPTVRVGGSVRTFDRVVACTPLTITRKLARGGAVERWTDDLPDLDYQGALNVVVMLRRPVTQHYWVAVVDSDVPFDGIVETTRTIDLDDTGGHHLVYLLNYLHRDDSRFARDPEQVKRDYLGALLDLIPEITLDDVVNTFFFKTPYVEPIWSTGFASRKPGPELVPGRVYLATTAQVYPRVTSWNSSIRVAFDAAAALLAAPAGKSVEARSA